LFIAKLFEAPVLPGLFSMQKSGCSHFLGLQKAPVSHPRLALSVKKPLLRKAFRRHRACRSRGD
jgi:RNase P protein component